MKVVKFGGSSVASAEQYKKVAEIILADKERKAVIVSAPGKRFDGDQKTTDLLIELAESINNGKTDQAVMAKVLDRYNEIISELHLDSSLIQTIKGRLEELISLYKEDEERLLDALKSSGEDNNAKVMTAYLLSLGHQASYISPKEAGVIVTDEPGNAQILPEAYERIAELRNREGILVIPGFFGYSYQGNIVTFPRGGSDITGSIIAAGLNAVEYENFTDVDSVYCVSPKMVKNPRELKEITYREMRELAYSGFSVFHDEALQPVFQKGIPVRVKNTNRPEAEGTRIVLKRELKGQTVIGIASDNDFCSLNITKYLMNRELGFGRRLLTILEDEGISYEHTPSGIDNMSIILRSHQLVNGKEERVLQRIKEELDVDDINIERKLAMIMVVGEGMKEAVGVAAKAAQALAESRSNIKMINQGSSEVSMMFGVDEESVTRAVNCLYNAYFPSTEKAIH
ncbi:aspartate kinase [Jeotgalibacillus proteolyticus]|uniref:Aspartokinase n=1 Tax=Jeotgalibacillus proteolyticus TaxID=2082395 RepID=A0A2S5GAG6_9BACL|nr:aspartate kinase [Jeotgalibacillus proteolyticus]PPA69915.1 aspartate kinase [Jeotgalibacillus proteolyticus]